MTARAIVGALPLLAGCLAAQAATLPNKHLRAWAPPPTVVEFTRLNYAGPLPLPDVHIREDWAGPEQKDGMLVYDVTSWEIVEGDIPRTAERATAFYGPDGFGWLGTWAEDGTYAAWEPKMVVLPPKPKVGATWEATHTKNGVTSKRSCEILRSNLCDGGLVSVCDSERPDGRIILRDHFCPGVGWSGFEGMMLIGDRPPVRMWSEKVVRDGVALPDPPEAPVETPPQ